MDSLGPEDPSTEVAIKARARALGFDAVGVARADEAWDAGWRLDQFVALGRQGDMDWMESTRERRRHPQAMWPEARSAIVVGLNYGPPDDPMAALERRCEGVISAYARGGDYHDVVKAKLKQLAGAVAEATGAEVKVFVDTAPVMEKPLAERAGLGWQGKHTNLVSREHGSWLFLGVVLTSAELEPDEPEPDHCGSCRACLDICPTDAFPAPYQLDARRCISYLTIEHKGPIPRELREGVGNRIYGCDDCLAVCPWNKFAATAREARLHARAENIGPLLGDLAGLDDAGFREVFAGSPIKRIGRDRFVRNVLIAIGNSGDRRLIPRVVSLLADASPLVRGAAAWALQRLADKETFFAGYYRRLRLESDPDVEEEWEAGARAWAPDGRMAEESADGDRPGMDEDAARAGGDDHPFPLLPGGEGGGGWGAGIIGLAGAEGRTATPLERSTSAAAPRSQTLSPRGGHGSWPEDGATADAAIAEPRLELLGAAARGGGASLAFAGSGSAAIDRPATELHAGLLAGGEPDVETAPGPEALAPPPSEALPGLAPAGEPSAAPTVARPAGTIGGPDAGVAVVTPSSARPGRAPDVRAPSISREALERIARRAVAVAGVSLAVLAGVLLLGVAAYRVVQPPFTATMAQRALAGAEIRRAPVRLERISPHLVHAVIAAEDSRFCAHRGFDRDAIAEALAQARNGGRLRGASTLSQQTVKNAFLWSGGGWPRKAVEAGLTVLVELAWPKRRILEVYLSAAEWGDGLFGAEAAAQARFGVSAADLSARQAALLAAVLPSPNRWRLDPPGEYVSSRAATLEARMRIVARDGLADCVLG